MCTTMRDAWNDLHRGRDARCRMAVQGHNVTQDELVEHPSRSFAADLYRILTIKLIDPFLHFRTRTI